MTKGFSFWRIVAQIGWAKSGLWAVTTDKEQRVYLFGCHLVKKGDDAALTILIGPFSLIIGIAT